MARAVPTVSVKLPPIAELRAPATQGRRSKKNKRQNRRVAARRNSDSYFSSLLEPESAQGSKVPDEIGYPTGTFQLTAQGTLTTGATGGDTCGISFSPIVGFVTTGGYPIVTYNSTTANSMSNATNIDWGSKNAVTAAFMATRPVSAVLEVSFIGSSSNDQGRLTAGTSFVGSGNTSPGNSWNTWANMPGMSTWPAKNGARVLWKPLDNTNFEFLSPSNSALAVYPQCFVACTGIPFNTTNFMWRVTCNFEAIPTSDTFDLVETKPSPVNLQSLQRAFEWAQEATSNVRPLVGVVGTALEMGRTAYGLYNGGGQRRLQINVPGAILAKSNGLRPLFSLEKQFIKSLKLTSKDEESGSEDETNDNSRILTYDEELGYGANPVDRSSSTVQGLSSLRNQAPAPPEGLARTSSTSSLGRSPRQRQ